MRWLPVAAAAVLAAAGGQSVRGINGKPIPLGRTLKIDPPGFHRWIFRAKGGERYHVEATWPTGKLRVQVGTERLDEDGDEDDDEATGRREIDVAPSGAHRWVATWKVPPEANVAFVWIALAGGGDPVRDEAIRVRITRR